ncbi:unnamed protein product [Rhizopus stolonifer]
MKYEIGLKVNELLEPLLLSENERENTLIANYISIISLRNLDSDSSAGYIRRTVVIPYMILRAIYSASGPRKKTCPQKKKKKKKRLSNRPVSRLNDEHKEHLINYFDENPTAVFQDAVDDLVQSFAGLEIRKSRVAGLMKDDRNLSIKVASRHPLARNSEKNLEARAI